MEENGISLSNINDLYYKGTRDAEPAGIYMSARIITPGDIDARAARLLRYY